MRERQPVAMPSSIDSVKIEVTRTNEAPTTSTPFDDMDVFLRLRTIDPDAFQVVRLLAARVSDGAAQYGRLDLANDKRNPFQEAAEEVADGLFYVGVALERAKRTKLNT